MNCFSCSSPIARSTSGKQLPASTALKSKAARFFSVRGTLRTNSNKAIALATLRGQGSLGHMISISRISSLRCVGKFSPIKSKIRSMDTRLPTGASANAVRSLTSISYTCLIMVRLLPPMWRGAPACKRMPETISMESSMKWGR